MTNARPNKRALEASRRERAAKKRAKKETREESAPTSTTTSERPAEHEVLAALDALHRARDAGEVDLEDFETTRAELLASLVP